MSLLSGQEFEEPRHREQQHIRIPVVQVGAGQEIRADHFQTVSSGAVASQHQSRRLDRPLNGWRLAIEKTDLEEKIAKLQLLLTIEDKSSGGSSNTGLA